MGLINMVYPCYSFSRIISTYLTSVVSFNAYPKRFGSFRPLKSLLIVENLWIHRQPSSITPAMPYPEPHAEALVGNFSLIGLAISSTSRLHKRGHKMPPFWQPMARNPSRISPDSMAVTLPASRHAANPLTICAPKPILFIRFCYNIKWDSVKGPLNTQESAKCYVPLFHCILYVCTAVSVDIPGW